MHKLVTLRDNLCEELEKVAKKEEINTSDLDTIDKLAHSIKNIDKILNESSYGNHSYGYNSYGYNSYARRGRDADNDGQYNEGRSRDGYSNRGSYDDYSRDMSDKLRRMMNETSSDRERDVIMRCISKLENE